MQNPLEITFHNIEHNDKVEETILSKFEKIKAVSKDITKCHIIVEKLSNHHQSANKSCVRLDLKVPHISDIVVCEKCTEDEADLSTTVIKVFKRAKSLLREEVSRIRSNQRKPKDVNLEAEPDEDEDEL